MNNELKFYSSVKTKKYENQKVFIILSECKINILKQKTERNNIKTFSEHIFYENPYIFDYFQYLWRCKH